MHQVVSYQHQRFQSCQQIDGYPHQLAQRGQHHIVNQAHDHPQDSGEQQEVKQCKPLAHICRCVNLFPGVEPKSVSDSFPNQNTRKRKEPTPEEQQEARIQVRKALRRPFPDPLKRVQAENIKTIFDSMFRLSGVPSQLLGLQVICKQPDFVHITKYVPLDQYEIVRGKEVKTTLMAPEIVSGLALAIRRLDWDGNLILSALGHFSRQDLQAFVQNEESQIGKFLNITMHELGFCEIYCTGMYDLCFFEKVMDKISKDYNPSICKVGFNPFGISSVFQFDEDFELYLKFKKVSTHLAIQRGKVYFDENRPVQIPRFSEEEFLRWRAERPVEV